jgi:hypothetical protein
MLTICAVLVSSCLGAILGFHESYQIVEVNKILNCPSKTWMKRDFPKSCTSSRSHYAILPKRCTLLTPGAAIPHQKHQIITGIDAFNEHRKGIIEAYKLFARIDRDVDGFIDVTDLIVYASSLGQSWTEKYAADILELIDGDHNGLIGFDDFLDWHNSGMPARTAGVSSPDFGEWARPAPPGASSTNSLSPDEIVRGLFPVHVIHSLMRGERVRPERKDAVTVFFSDVVGFTEISSTFADAGGSGEAASDLLDRLFRRLDWLADRMGVTKIETIGDAYLCATNLAGDQVGGKQEREEAKKEGAKGVGEGVGEGKEGGAMQGEEVDKRGDATWPAFKSGKETGNEQVGERARKEKVGEGEERGRAEAKEEERSKGREVRERAEGR